MKVMIPCSPFRACRNNASLLSRSPEPRMNSQVGPPLRLDARESVAVKCARRSGEHMLREYVAAGCVSAMLGIGVLTIGCGGDTVDGGSPSDGNDAGGAAGNGGTDAGVGDDVGTGEAAAGAAGEGGGTAAPDRGDPDDFPTECLATCEEACAQLASCGGADSTGFPLDEQTCLDRCELANFGPGGSQAQGAANFKCCASQADCVDVKECGGWLSHPETVDACERYCTCRMSGAMIELTTGHQAPEGYRFAPDALMLEPVASARISRCRPAFDSRPTAGSRSFGSTARPQAPRLPLSGSPQGYSRPSSTQQGASAQRAAISSWWPMIPPP